MLANIFFLSYGNPSDLVDKNLFRFFNAKEIIDGNRKGNVFFDNDLLLLIKALFNSSCEKVQIIPKIKPKLCKKIDVIIGKDIYFRALDEVGMCVGAVLVSGLSGCFFNKTEREAFEGVVYNNVSSNTSCLSIKIIHSVCADNGFDIKRMRVGQKPYSLKLSVLSNGEIYEKRILTGTVSLCKQITEKNEKAKLIKSFLKKGAFVNSLVVEPEPPSDPDYGIDI